MLRPACGCLITSQAVTAGDVRRFAELLLGCLADLITRREVSSAVPWRMKHVLDRDGSLYEAAVGANDERIKVEKLVCRSSKDGRSSYFTMAHNRSRETQAPPEQIWKIWSDTSTWAKWNPDVLSVSLDGPFATGTTGEMRTKAGGTHRIRLEGVEPGRRFRLETAVLPASRFSFRCEVVPAAAGSRISQGITIGGPLGPVFTVLMGERIAAGFVSLLDGLANYAEAAASD